jgi:hypothetical protein
LSGTQGLLDETSLGSDLGSQIGAIFAASAERDAANAILAPVIASSEGHRVAVACLKLAGGSLKELKECAQAALTDYRDVLAWAEYPRQMRLDVRANSEQKAAARRADAQEYTHWLDTTEK